MPLEFHRSNQIMLAAKPSAIVLGADDRTALVACQGKLIKIDLVDSSQTELCDITHEVNQLSLSVESRLVAVSTRDSAEVLVYDIDSGQRKQTMSRDGAPGSLRTAATNRMALSPDGKTIVSTTTGSRIFVSNVVSGQWEHIMFVKYDGCDVSASPDGKHVVLFGAANAGELSGHLTMYRVRRGLQPLWTRWHESDQAITNAQFSGDSRSLVTSGADDGVRVWDVESGESQHHLDQVEHDAPNRRAWSFGVPNLIARLSAELAIHDIETGESLFRKPIEKFTHAAVSITGTTLVCSRGDDIDVWKPAAPK